jgi:hypothetical protein
MGPKQNKKAIKNDKSSAKPQTPEKSEPEVELVIPDYEYISSVDAIESIEIAGSCVEAMVQGCFKTITDNWVNGHLPQHCSLE